MPQPTRKFSAESLPRFATTSTGVLIICSDFKCSHHTKAVSYQWPDDLRFSDIEPRFVCEVCGERGADVRPDFPTYWPPR